jgi:hypothetical protein
MVAITEIGTGTPKFVEIQNVSGRALNLTGWEVALNDNFADIHDENATRSPLPLSMAAGEIVVRHDDDTNYWPYGDYWGEDILWRTRGPGWVMVLDAQGNVADFVVWGYSEAGLSIPPSPPADGCEGDGGE